MTKRLVPPLPPKPKRERAKLATPMPLDRIMNELLPPPPSSLDSWSLPHATPELSPLPPLPPGRRELPRPRVPDTDEILARFDGRSVWPSVETRAKPSSGTDDGNETLNVPVVCAREDKLSVIVFRKTGTGSSVHYDLERILTALAPGESGPAPVTVPAGLLNFDHIKCPHCAADLLVSCGACSRLVCEGLTTTSGTARLFTCACGHVGTVQYTLKAITGTEGRASSSKGRALPAPIPTEAPARRPRLPKL